MQPQAMSEPRMPLMQGLGPLHPTIGLLLGGAEPHVDSTSEILTFTCVIEIVIRYRKAPDTINPIPHSTHD